MTIQISVLGLVELRSNNQKKEIRGLQQRALLVSVAVSESRVVPVDSLIAELWAEEPPLHAHNALQAHVSRLRRQLAELDQVGGARLRGVSSGYLLELQQQDEFDANRFTLALSAAKLHSHSLEETNRKLRAALNTWRGPIFGGPVGGSICQAAAARLEESRMAAFELYFDNELKLGNHAGIIAELSDLVCSDALNERLCEQLMVALYRSGRQTDALSVYHRMRRRLVDNLGVEPSPTLRLFEQAILDHDPLMSTGADYTKMRSLVQVNA